MDQLRPKFEERQCNTVAEAFGVLVATNVNGLLSIRQATLVATRSAADAFFSVPSKNMLRIA
jgi:hypothetical protein